MENGRDENFAVDLTFSKNGRTLIVADVRSDYAATQHILDKAAQGWKYEGLEARKPVKASDVTMGGLFGVE